MVICLVDWLSHLFGDANGTTHGSFPTIPFGWFFVDRLSHTFDETNGTTHGSFRLPAWRYSFGEFGEIVISLADRLSHLVGGR